MYINIIYFIENLKKSNNFSKINNTNNYSLQTFASNFYNIISTNYYIFYLKFNIKIN